MFEFKWSPKRPDMSKFDGLPDQIQTTAMAWARHHSRLMARAMIDRLKSGHFADLDGTVRRLPYATEGYLQRKTEQFPAGRPLQITGQLLNSTKGRVKRDGDGIRIIISFAGARAPIDWSKLEARAAALQQLADDTENFKWVHVEEYGMVRGGRPVTVRAHRRLRSPTEENTLKRRLAWYKKRLEDRRKPPSNARLGTILSGWAGTGVFQSRRITPLLALSKREKERFYMDLLLAIKKRTERTLKQAVS